MDHRSLLGGSILVLLLGATATSAEADTVVLTNGNAYEDVVAEVGDDGVSIRLAFGVITLSHDRVARVEKAASPLAAYLDRRAELASQIDSDAASWLALAEWARRHDLPHGARQAALEAARLQPRLDGLAAFLEPAGYRFDEELGRWLELDEYMARRGLVRSAGGWITREEQQARADERQAALQAALETVRERQPANRPSAEEAGPLVVVSVNQPQPVVSTIPFWGVWSHPRFVTAPHHPQRRPLNHRDVHHGPAPQQRRSEPKAHRHSGYRSLVDRQPGSFLPVDRSAADRTEH